MWLEISRQIYEIFKIKFYKNSSSRRRVVPCGPTGGLIDIWKPIGAL
jgi:hypothetical protein